MPPSPHHGLEWRPTTFGYEPNWTEDPAIDIIKNIASVKLGPAHCCGVTFVGQGAFSKVYNIHCDQGDYIMRITLPVDPQYKTQSEAATLDFVRLKSDAPVPSVIAFEASNDNQLGFEWMLMERMPGKPLEKVWKSLSMHQKRVLVKRIALYISQLFRSRLQHIGNLFHSTSCLDAYPDGGELTNFRVGRIVSMEFFWADHINQEIPRGPFRTSRQWLEARLLLRQNESKRILQVSNDIDDVEDAEQTGLILRRLFSLLPSIFQYEPNESVEDTALYHNDLSQQNIMVDDDGNLTAIIDWECVSAVPLWKACQLPWFLEGKERKEMPFTSAYGVDEDGVLENGKVSDLYWEHLLEYEQTELRKEFLREIKRIEPSWFSMYSSNSNLRKADFETAVEYSDEPFRIRRICKWLDGLERGDDMPSLRRQLGRS